MKYYHKCVKFDCNYTLKILQLLGDFVAQTPYRGSAPGPRWGTPVPRPTVVSPHPKPPSAAFVVQ